MFKIRCYVLFDITQTNVVNRNKPTEADEYILWLNKRNTQCNFDTILQVISLRSQPENIQTPKKIEIRFNKVDYFGFVYEKMKKTVYPCWTFEFEINHASVFDNGITELGLLYSDCENVPMINCTKEYAKMVNKLDTTDELRNIFFEVIENE